MKIAVIGGGVSGLSVAYFLQSKNIDFVLFEKEKHLGGNAHTRKIIHNNKEKFVDMAVNDFNPKTYKTLINLLKKTNSSTGQVKVNTTFFSPNSFLFKESELNDTELVENIHRFKHEAVEVLFNKDFRWHSVKEYFEEKGYSQKFLSKYLYPRIQGLFFYPPEGLENLPVSFVMNFYSLQCGFKYNENPSSSRFNFKNGASSWIENLAKSIPSQNIIKSESPKIVKSEKGFKIYYSNGEVLVDKLVFACHADDLCRQYAAILSEKQYQILSKIKYAKMQAVAHFDINYLPVKKTDFSAYNCLVKDVSEDKNNIYFVGGYTNGIGLHENSLW